MNVYAKIPNSLNFNMSVQIQIFKQELEKHPSELGQQLTGFSSQVKELENACLYTVAPGKLMEMMALLQKFRVSYGVHSPTDLLLEE